MNIRCMFSSHLIAFMIVIIVSAEQSVSNDGRTVIGSSIWNPSLLPWLLWRGKNEQVAQLSSVVIFNDTNIGDDLNTTITANNLTVTDESFNSTTSTIDPSLPMETNSSSTIITDTTQITIITTSTTSSSSSSNHRRRITKSTTSQSSQSLLSTTTPTTITTLPINCEKLSTDQLYEKLERVGGRNQRFMANTPDEAGRNFVGLLPNPEDIHDAVAQPNDFSTDSISHKLIDPYACDDDCELIRQRLTSALIDRHLSYEPLNDTGPAEVEEGGSGKVDSSVTWRGSGGCYLDKFIAIGNCSSRGDEEVWGYEKLCSACHGVYLLSGDCFPQFFNAIVCNRLDARCIFDRFTNGAHGKCQERTLSFKVMRNNGTDECEDWLYEHLDVPIACECYLSKSSWLRA